jgi:transposase
MVSTKKQVDTMHSKTLQRRRHSDDLKAQVLHECSQPGASVAAIALSHNLNANLVHKWRHRALRDLVAPQPPAPPPFIALPVHPVPEPAPVPPADIRIELRRGAATVSVSWPVSAAGECAAWLQEWLR